METMQELAKPAVYTPPKPRSLEAGIKRYGANPTPPQAKRLRSQMMRAYGEAVKLSGAARTARLKKLAVLAEQIPGLTVIPADKAAKRALAIAKTASVKGSNSVKN